MKKGRRDYASVSKERPNAEAQTLNFRHKLRHVLVCHIQALFASLASFRQGLIANLMTASVIGIALAFPTGLYWLLQDLQAIGNHWNYDTQITVFLKRGVSELEGRALVAKIKANSDVANANYISPEEGLKDFEKQSGLGNILAQLQDNPLPGVIIVQPALSVTSLNRMDQIIQYFQKFPEVDVTQLDMAWIKRLYALINLAKQGVGVLGLLLAVAVILIIGNTMRLAIQNYRNEIEVIKLIGGTDAFIRRPFLYSGIWFGICGGIIACILVDSVLFWLNSPIKQLAGLYQSNFYLHEISFSAASLVILLSMGLGLLGSWLAVGRQLAAIVPE